MNFEQTLAAKSDQLNADDLIGSESKRIKITNVEIVQVPEQPAIFHYEGDEGKPWKPCKSMRRLIAHLWGVDEKSFVGRSIDLFRDPNVRFGSDLVGGIRIKGMSDIARKETVSLRTSRNQRIRVNVEPIQEQNKKTLSPTQQGSAAQKYHDATLEEIKHISSLEGVTAFLEKNQNKIRRLHEKYQELYDSLMGALTDKQNEIKNKEDEENG